MQFCQEHWDSLREAIDERNLGHLVAQNDERAAMNTVADLLDVNMNQTIRTFDPLMYAHWGIVTNVTDWVGVQLFFPNEDGTERCPICFLTETHKAECTDEKCDIDNFDHWIEYGADDAAEHWERLKAEERGDVREPV